jgi:hypothetical protein
VLLQMEMASAPGAAVSKETFDAQTNHEPVSPVSPIIISEKKELSGLADDHKHHALEPNAGKTPVLQWKNVAYQVPSRGDGGATQGLVHFFALARRLS